LFPRLFHLLYPLLVCHRVMPEHMFRPDIPHRHTRLCDRGGDQKWKLRRGAEHLLSELCHRRKLRPQAECHIPLQVRHSPWQRWVMFLQP